MTDFKKIPDETPKQMWAHLYPHIKAMPDDAQIRLVMMLARVHPEVTETKEFVEFAHELSERHPEIIS